MYIFSNLKQQIMFYARWLVLNFDKPHSIAMQGYTTIHSFYLADMALPRGVMGLSAGFYCGIS